MTDRTNKYSKAGRFKTYALSIFLSTASIAIQAQSTARYHIVEEGQTLYAIARLYGIPATELMKLNPQAGDAIKPGDQLILPTTGNGSGTQFIKGKGNTSSPGTRPCKEMYQVQKKDNLFRIAQNFHLTIEELVDANPTLTPESKVKKGEWICIPYTWTELKAIAEKEEAARVASLAASKRSSVNHINMAVILPLKEGGDRGARMIEFYQGMLMAVDSIRKQGVSVDVHAYHSGTSIADINFVLSKPELTTMDVIFGPLDMAHTNSISTFCKQHKIKLVMPFAGSYTSIDKNSFIYVATAPNDIVNRNGTNMVIQQFRDNNFVFIQANEQDTRGMAFTSYLKQQLTNQGIATNQINFDANDVAFLSAFNTQKENLVIINNTSTQATLNLFKKLKKIRIQHPGYRITLLGYPEWSTLIPSNIQDLHTFNTFIYSPFFYNPNQGTIQHFERRFKANFNKEMQKTTPCYGMLGMDLGYHFLHGIATLGDYFDERQASLHHIPLQGNYRFTQANNLAPHLNEQTYLIHFNTTGSIDLLELK